MSVLKIPYLNVISPGNPALIAGQLINSGTKIKIDKINWNDFPHFIDTSVFLGYTDQYLWLHYIVLNENLRAVCRKDQDPVWQDSCVEFFVKQGGNYRNFEFNCLGICLSAIGPDRHVRESLDVESLIQILRFPSLDIDTLQDKGIPFDWSLTIAIPLHLIDLRGGDEFYANFYKCGDETSIPHYISWSAIGTPSPDFHCPDFFAPAELVK
jgi:hypothetical protein